MTTSNSLDAYFELMESLPELFTPSDIYPIITDKEAIQAFIASTNKSVGVVYKSDYHIMVVDLIRDDNGGCYTYERVLPAKSGRGVVCIPEYKGKYILLKQYRHPIRNTQICFPRGFGEDQLTPNQNAEKELYEEIGAKTNDIKLLGEIAPDSGFVGDFVDIALCKISSYNQNSHSEGITVTLLCTYDEIAEMIKSGEINDSFTICAFSLLGNTKTAN